MEAEDPICVKCANIVFGRQNIVLEERLCLTSSWEGEGYSIIYNYISYAHYIHIYITNIYII